MKARRNLKATITCVIALYAMPAFPQYSGLAGFSEAFLHDYSAAQEMVNRVKSAEPLIALQQRYTNETEQAELEVSAGLIYNQRTGMVDNSRAVVHFTAALRHDLPEKTCIEIFMWRGNSQEQLKKPKEALADYLRGLLACSYHDLTGGWPEIQPSKVPLFLNSPDPENVQRVRDRNQYRNRIDFQRFLLMQRYYFIDAVKRVRPEAANSDGEIAKIIETLSPDSSRYGTIINWLKSENKQPWP